MTKENGKTKAWKVTISGSYRKDLKGGYVDFSKVTGIVPLVDEEVLNQQVRKRYAAMWLSSEENRRKFPEGVKSIREVHVDKAEVVEVDQFSFVGKDIMDLDYEELQDLAVMKDLRSVPLYKKSSLRRTQDVAYAAYALNVLKLQAKNNTKEAENEWRRLTDIRFDGFNASKNPPIIIDGQAHVDTTQRMTNEEIIGYEQKSPSDPKQTLTLPELKEIAKMKNIPHAPNIGFEALYARIFSTAAA